MARATDGMYVNPYLGHFYVDNEILELAHELAHIPLFHVIVEINVGRLSVSDFTLYEFK